MKTRNENIEIEDITLIGDDDITVPREIESVTMEDDQPRLTDYQIEALKEKHGGQFQRAAFVATVSGLGVAIEHERGYFPVPAIWYSQPDFNKASQYADELNREVFDLEPDQAMIIVASSMRHGGE